MPIFAMKHTAWGLIVVAAMASCHGASDASQAFRTDSAGVEILSYPDDFNEVPRWEFDTVAFLTVGGVIV